MQNPFMFVGGLGMEPELDRAARANEEGACWTCLDKNWQCDGGLPGKSLC